MLPMLVFPMSYFTRISALGQLHLRPDLSVKTVALYTQDARRFATWVQQEHPGLKVGEVTPTDAKSYCDHSVIHEPVAH